MNDEMDFIHSVLLVNVKSKFVMLLIGKGCTGFIPFT